MAERRFRYIREDFGELPVHLHHLEIYLDFIGDHVDAVNILDMTARKALDEIELDADSLEIMRVEWCTGTGDGPDCPGEALRYEYLQNRNKLIVRLPQRVQEGGRFRVKTVTRCFPSDHILEGIYKDATPPGAPQQYMSQCQQWGFQRIMPIFDDTRAKCTMTTTIEADASYTHLISNGNISRRSNPEGRPVLKPGSPSRQVITYENPIPMAPYLFLVCVGTWDTLEDSVTYASGRTVQLEYLVPPGRAENARIPMEILKQAVPWVHETQDYEYTADTYRTICMNKSNFGGMENVGNTTIVTDAALIDEHTMDQSLLYAHAVIVHEFEHNQCGSETTMETPFDVWLNEAYTVDVERQFMADIFDPGFIRLRQLDTIRHPFHGPLAIEDSGYRGRIVREGFNDPDELIDGVTYVKAAEVIRMLRLILGPDHFKAGKTLYFTRYHNGNADTDQFFECFEEVSGRSLVQFKERWLYSAGYPRVVAHGTFEPEARRYRVSFRQELEAGQKPFHLPIDLALVGRDGQDIPGTHRIFELQEEQAELVLDEIEEPPAFASLNRDYSFYGTFRQEGMTHEVLSLQARSDPNPYNRVEAMRRLTDIQRIRLLHEPDAAIDRNWLSLYEEILPNQSIPASRKAYLLHIEEHPLNRAYATWYQELVGAREKLMLTVNAAFRELLVDIFMGLDTYAPRQSPNHGIEERMLKQVLLELIAIDDRPESHRLILDHFRAATTATDRVGALGALNRSSAPERHTVLEEAYQAWHRSLSGYANYLRVVSSGTNPDVFDMIERERGRPAFDITLPTWSRALFLPMGSNNKMIWTDRGIGWLTETVIELSRINATTAGRLLNTFQHVNKLRPHLQSRVKPALERIVQEVTEEVSPSIRGQAAAYLASS